MSSSQLRPAGRAARALYKVDAALMGKVKARATRTGFDAIEFWDLADLDNQLKANVLAGGGKYACLEIVAHGLSTYTAGITYFTAFQYGSMIASSLTNGASIILNACFAGACSDAGCISQSLATFANRTVWGGKAYMDTMTVLGDFNPPCSSNTEDLTNGEVEISLFSDPPCDTEGCNEEAFNKFDPLSFAASYVGSASHVFDWDDVQILDILTVILKQLDSKARADAFFDTTGLAPNYVFLDKVSGSRVEVIADGKLARINEICFQISLPEAMKKRMRRLAGAIVDPSLFNVYSSRVGTGTYRAYSPAFGNVSTVDADSEATAVSNCRARIAAIQWNSVEQGLSIGPFIRAQADVNDREVEGVSLPSVAVRIPIVQP